MRVDSGLRRCPSVHHSRLTKKLTNKIFGYTKIVMKFKNFDRSSPKFQKKIVLGCAASAIAAHALLRVNDTQPLDDPEDPPAEV